jgi:predicted RNA-binding Zn ribbon-like protein
MTKTKLNSEQRDGFFFLGNEVVLDFLNTRPVPDVKPVELLPDFPSLLRWFQATGLLSGREAANLKNKFGESKRAAKALRTALALRDQLRKVIIAWEKGASVPRSMIDKLDDLMSAYPMKTRLKADSSGIAKELWFDVQEPEDLLAPLAYSAASLFAEADRIRIRKCGQCVLHFHDTSKKGTRRWCSMQLCGNRLKVAAYAARQKAL